MSFLEKIKINIYFSSSHSHHDFGNTIHALYPRRRTQRKPQTTWYENRPLSRRKNVYSSRFTPNCTDAVHSQNLQWNVFPRHDKRLTSFKLPAIPNVSYSIPVNFLSTFETSRCFGWRNYSNAILQGSLSKILIFTLLLIISVLIGVLL